MKQFDLKINPRFEVEVCKKAEEIVKRGEKSGLIDGKHLGELSVYIDEPPTDFLMIITGPENMPLIAGKKIYVGGNIEE